MFDLRDEPLTQWLMMARMTLLRSINLAKSDLTDMDQIYCCRRIRLHVLVSPGFRHTGIIAAFMTAVCKNIFPDQPPASVSVIGVVSLQTEVPMMLDASFLAKPPHKVQPPKLHM